MRQSEKVDLAQRVKNNGSKVEVENVEKNREELNE